jgi:thiol-disulfide isomerase/thioredoxin
MEVQFVSASWCKACIKIKPDFVAHCKIIDLEPKWIDYDELEDKESIKGLPTIMFRIGDAEWTHYVASQFEAWKEVSAAAVSTPMDVDDF